MATRRRTDRSRKTNATEAIGDPPPPKPGVNQEDVARRAYELYQRRGGADGNDLDDWLQAERDLKIGGSR